MNAAEMAALRSARFSVAGHRDMRLGRVERAGDFCPERPMRQAAAADPGGRAVRPGMEGFEARGGARLAPGVRR